jgi:hypothetical protein
VIETTCRVLRLLVRTKRPAPSPFPLPQQSGRGADESRRNEMRRELLMLLRTSQSRKLGSTSFRLVRQVRALRDRLRMTGRRGARRDENVAFMRRIAMIPGISMTSVGAVAS